MDTLTTIDLYTILDDPTLLAKLHELQRDRLNENALTGGERPPGMRLSEPDAIRRVKSSLDPFWRTPFDEGVGARGHAMEDYLEVALFHSDYAPLSGKAYDTQSAIPWHAPSGSSSAFDFVVENHMGGERVISCKSSIGSAKPSAANVAQERRMMALGGYPPNTVFEIWVISPSTMRAVGPYEYTLDEEHITEARAELQAVSDAWTFFSKLDDPTQAPEWNDRAAWSTMFGLRSPSTAFHIDSLDACAAAEKRVRLWERTHDAKKLAEAEHDAAKELLYPVIKEQVALARANGQPDAKKVSCYSLTDVWDFTVTTNGQVRPKRREISVENAAA